MHNLQAVFILPLWLISMRINASEEIIYRPETENDTEFALILKLDGTAEIRTDITTPNCPNQWKELKWGEAEDTLFLLDTTDNTVDIFWFRKNEHSGIMRLTFDPPQNSKPRIPGLINVLDSWPFPRELKESTNQSYHKTPASAQR